MKFITGLAVLVGLCGMISVLAADIFFDREHVAPIMVVVALIGAAVMGGLLQLQRLRSSSD